MSEEAKKAALQSIVECYWRLRDIPDVGKYYVTEEDGFNEDVLDKLGIEHVRVTGMGRNALIGFEASDLDQINKLLREAGYSEGLTVSN